MFSLLLLSDICMHVCAKHLGSRSLIDLLVINNCCVPTRVNFMLLLLRALKIIQALLIFSLLCKGGSWEDASSGHYPCLESPAGWFPHVTCPDCCFQGQLFRFTLRCSSAAAFGSPQALLYYANARFLLLHDIPII